MEKGQAVKKSLAAVDCPVFMGLKGRPLVWAVNVVASSSYLLFGYDNGVMSGIITADQFFAVFGVMSTTMQGLVTALFELGAFFGALACVWLGDSLGRRRACFIGSAVMVIGAVLQAASYTRVQLIVGRIVSGVGIGFLTSTAPPYISECTTAAKRGLDIAIMLTSLIIGINIAYWTDYGCAYIASSVSWRIPLILQVVWCIVICILVCFLPDSPRWLYSRGRSEDGAKALQALRDLPRDHPQLVEEQNDILAAIELDFSSASSWKACFVDGGIRGDKRVALACLTLIFQQLTGTNTLTYYSTIIYEQSVGLSRRLSLLMGGFLQVWFLVASLLAWFTIDRVGRRILFIIGYCGMAMMYLLLTIMLAYPQSKACGIVATIATFLFQGFFTNGTMANTWLYPNEILPILLRTRGAAYTAASSWIFGFIVVMVTPPGISGIGKYFYLIWVVLNLAMMAFVYLFYPETSNLSLEAVDILFVDNYQGWRMAVKRSIEMHKNARKSGKGVRDLEQVHLARARNTEGRNIADDKPKTQTNEYFEAAA